MESEKDLIILVDDNPANLRIGKNILSEKYRVATAPSAEKLFGLLENNTPSMILLDINMPEMDGYEAIKILKAKPETMDIPVIFLTARAESDDELEGLSLGAVDYIIKPFQPVLLLKRIEVHLLIEAQRITLEKQTKDLQYFNNNLRHAFSTYLSEDVVEEIINDPTRLQLGGIKRHMTAMFTDIKDFVSISEALIPELVIELLNYYLSSMSDIILDQKGTIDKYEGDAIISFFGAPLELPDHALRACVSALAMKRLEDEVNRHIVDNVMNISPFLTRIGINTGDMVVGNMGTQKKMNYTIIGNAVNLTSRLELINKLYGTWIIASEHTMKETGGLIFARRLDHIRVVGMKESVRIYELMDLAGDASPELRERIEMFHAALDLFDKRDWSAAEASFRKTLEMSPNDQPSILYLDRCRKFQEKEPDKDWDGIFNMSEKR